MKHLFLSLFFKLKFSVRFFYFIIIIKSKNLNNKKKYLNKVKNIYIDICIYKEEIVML